MCGMCRNIRCLHNFEPATTDEEVREAALQFVRKVSGSTHPSRANTPAFEQAIARSQGRNLMAPTLEAQYYARLVFDQELHDRLLNDVLAAEPREPGLTLINVLAQKRAKALLESGKDYF